MGFKEMRWDSVDRFILLKTGKKGGPL